MAGIIRASDSNMAMAAMFGRPSESLQADIRENLDRFAARVGNAAGDLVTRARDRFYDFTEGAFARGVNAIRNKVDKTWKRDAIYVHDSLAELQNAKPRMRPHIMAHPGTRKLYQDHRIEGYGEGYHDEQPGAIGRDHYDYRRSISGMLLKERTNDNEVAYVTRIYIEPHVAETPLTIDDKSVVAKTWAYLDECIEELNYDYTSDDNALIG